MSVSKYCIEPLNAGHNRNDFVSGSDPLDRYIKEQASQDMRRRISACFVATDVETKMLAGYYTLASTSISLHDLPEAIRKKLPRYPVIPAVIMGRLAVAKTHRGLGLGAVLLANALNKALIAEVAAYALVVDAKDQNSTDFYVHHGFMQLIGGVAESKLFLPLATVNL